MTVLPLPPRGEWFGDQRGVQADLDLDRDVGRALRVSWHAELGVVVLSTWRDDSCVATVRLEPDDAARLVAVLAAGLAAQVPPVEDTARTGT